METKTRLPEHRRPYYRADQIDQTVAACLLIGALFFLLFNGIRAWVDFPAWGWMVR